jgi:pyridoxamine 5'-phosphate oxidase
MTSDAQTPEAIPPESVPPGAGPAETEPPAGSLRQWLRGLPMFPAEPPALQTAQLPVDPQTLFVTWLREVVEAGQPAARVMTLSTSEGSEGSEGSEASGGAGTGPSARSVLLTDLDERGWQFATHASSPKGRALAAHPFAALTFFWPVLARQVRLAGPVQVLSTDAAARDFRERSETSRASLLVGRQSEPIERPEDYRAAFERARTALRNNPDLVDADWAAYALAPERVEFWQGSTTGPQTRVLYRRLGQSWAASSLYP